MHPEMEMLKCSIVRGGTSKGIFIYANELPNDRELRDKVILSIFGSPDVRQIDGLGGADTLTSKLAIISSPTVEGADVDYTFGQVSLIDSFVDYGGNCGNISSAVGPYAIDHGMVPAVEPITTVKIHMTNTGKVLTAYVPVRNGKAIVEGDFAIDGVPGTGAKVTLDWSDAVGGATGDLLPTGNAKDTIIFDGKEYIVSIVDAGNIVVFINAEQLGIDGRETPNEIDSNLELMENIEQIRGRVCERIGLVRNWKDARKVTPYQPFFAMVSKSRDYECFNGNSVKTEDIDLVSRLTFMQKMHKTYAITGTVATGAAARVKGSVVWDLLSDEARKSSIIKIGHPAGVVPVESEARYNRDSVAITKLYAYRTARIIMDGYVYVKKSIFKTNRG